ncbi:hypothetical protein DAI22_06g075500 [Oryza sativa Japonica Group]|nr:hypothetical protein DAI22_06g075500 [Oryza sativa Japonica Group]
MFILITVLVFYYVPKSSETSIWRINLLIFFECLQLFLFILIIADKTNFVMQVHFGGVHSWIHRCDVHFVG